MPVDVAPKPRHKAPFRSSRALAMLHRVRSAALVAGLSLATLAAALPSASGCAGETLPSQPDPNGSGGADAGCVAHKAPCPVVFTYPLNNEQSVVLRGD